MTGIKSIPAVFLDTQVFDQHGRDFQAANLRRLVRLCTDGVIKLLLTTITANEIRAHLDKDAKDAIKTLRNYKRASRLVKKFQPHPNLDAFDEQSFRNELLAEFSRFLTESNVQIVSTEDVSSETVFQDYFAGVAPFASGEKKHEFPDAFAIAAICNWCAKHECAVFAVSGDYDWKSTFKKNKQIRYMENLEVLFEEFQDAEIVAAIKDLLIFCRDEIDQRTYANASNLKFSLADVIYSGKIEKSKIEHIKFGNVRVVEASNHNAIASIECAVTVESTVTADYGADELTSQDVNKEKTVTRLRGNVVTDFESNILVYLKYTGVIPESISVEHIEFETKDVVVNANVGTFDEIEDSDG
jgi:hypothetical protein